jgi:hypothetical protein
MRELAQQVITTFSGSPRRGLTAENAYTHSMYRVSEASTSACICDPVDALRPRVRGLRRHGLRLVEA